MTAKEFEQGIKTGLNKLSEQEVKQIRDEFNSEPDYPIPSQNPKKIIVSKMIGGYIFHFKNRKFRALKNDRGVKFSFQKSKKLDLQKLMGGYIFHFKNCFFQ